MAGNIMRQPKLAAAAASALAGHPGVGRHGAAARCPNLSHRSWYGAGIQYGHGQNAGRWRTGEGRLHRRPGRQGGRSLGADRSATVSGRIRSSGRKKGCRTEPISLTQSSTSRLTVRPPRADRRRRFWPNLHPVIASLSPAFGRPALDEKRPISATNYGEKVSHFLVRSIAPKQSCLSAIVDNARRSAGRGQVRAVAAPRP